MKKENDFCVEKGRKKRWGIPDKFLFEDSRELFVNAKVDDPKEIELKWEKPNKEGLIEFLVKKKGFSESRVENGLKRLKLKESGGV
jgi:flap endonuclease-1